MKTLTVFPINDEILLYNSPTDVATLRATVVLRIFLARRMSIRTLNKMDPKNVIATGTMVMIPIYKCIQNIDTCMHKLAIWIASLLQLKYQWNCAPAIFLEVVSLFTSCEGRQQGEPLTAYLMSLKLAPYIDEMTER